jgi:CPA1 family monovalent cation:H+ antiporter
MGEIEIALLLTIAAAGTTLLARLAGVHYTISLLVLGLALSAFVPELTLSSDLILLIFLPPLIFEASFALNARLLWSVRTEIAVLALPGVLLATVVGGAIVRSWLGYSWTIALTFGVIVAATDPVAVLAMFRKANVSERLSATLEGESLFNDGVALVLLATVVDSLDHDISPFVAILEIVIAMIGGGLLGAAIGWLAQRAIALIDEHLTEMSISVATAYGAFLAAESIHLSGVVATIAAAMTLASLGRRKGWIYSHGSEQMLADLWEFLAFVANAGLFLLIGLTVETAGLTDHPREVLAGILAAVVARAVTAYGLGEALRWFGQPLAGRELHVVFWGGLRGAVALAAVLSLPESFPHRDELLAMTYAAVIFTLVVQGATIPALLKQLGLTFAERAEERAGAG